MTQISAARPRRSRPLPPLRSGGRDLRLDFFRGMSLIIIYLNHSPEGFISWISTRRFGFADATEIFLFGSGYAAGIVYCRLAARGQVLYASLHLLHRVWNIYVAHLFIFMLLTAEIAFVVYAFSNDVYIKDMAALQIVRDPEVTLIQALLLKFQPVLLDILPLFIVIQLSFLPLIVPTLRAPLVVLVGSLVLYLAARHFGWQLPSYPPDTIWFFNPLAWQLLFVIGAVACTQPQFFTWLRRYDRVLLPAAALYAGVALLYAQTWNFPVLQSLLPDQLRFAFAIEDKIDLHPARLLHFLAVAYLVSHFVKADAAWLRWKIAQPLIRVGQFPLQIFCASIIVDFTVHVIATEGQLALPAYIAVTAMGLAMLLGLAYLAHYYRQLAARAEAPAGRSDS